MNDAKKTLKQALSFALVVVLIVATLFGLDVPYGIEDVATDFEETEVTDTIVADEQTNEEPTPSTEATTEKEVDEVAPSTDEVETQPQETAPTEDVTTEDAASSESVDVAETTEPQPDATEGDVQNA